MTTAQNYLFVPMHLDVMVLNKTASITTPFLRFQMDYRKLKEFDNPEPRPFEGQSTKQPEAGVYLHWTMPKALRNGTHKEDGSTEFPLVPNRWLVVRVQAGVSQDKAVKAWVLESDYMDSKNGTSPFVDYRSLDINGVPKNTKIGRCIKLTKDIKLSVQEYPFLKAVGPASVTFSVFSPGVENVFSFCDKMLEADDNRLIDQGKFTYYVAGWYSDSHFDPLGGTKWEANTDSKYKGTYANNTFDWLVYSDSSDLPKQMLVHAMVSAVPWDRNANNRDADNYPDHIPDNVKVAVGNTAIDALAAIIRLHKEGKQGQIEADLLEAFQYNLLDEFDKPGSAEALNMAIRKHWYVASGGGTLWDIVSQEDPKSATTPGKVKWDINDKQKEALAELNKIQAEFDRQERIMESMQWNLYSLWWKNMNIEVGKPIPPVDDDEDLKAWLREHLPLEIGKGSSCKNPSGADYSGEDFYIFKVKAQKNLVSLLTSQVNAAKEKVLELIKVTGLVLKPLSLPGYYHPGDPVLLITGLGRSTNFDSENGLICRLSSQVVSALEVEGITYNREKIKDKIPSLVYPAGVLPDSLQNLHTEAFFLSPYMFAVNVFKDAAKAEKVAQAIKKLPSPAVGVSFAPESHSVEVWKQPWIPLLLDWQITVFKEPAYEGNVKEATCRFNSKKWKFDGTDYNWIGPVQPGKKDFNEGSSSQMKLEGRTFITPYPALNLAKQLEEYVKKHSLRDEELEKLLKDLEGYIKEIKNQDILSQRLGGMMSMMVQRDHSGVVNPSNEIAQIIGNSYQGCPGPCKNSHSEYAEAVFDFAPMSGSFFVINKLSVIDTFGRTIDLMLANYSKGTDDIKDREFYFYPIAGRNMKAVTTKDPNKQLGKSYNPTERMLQLTPRLIQDGKLSFFFLSNDEKREDINCIPGANPICCWIVPNHLNRSLAVYAPDGTAWGEMYLSLHAGNKYVPVWLPDPANPQAPQSIDLIPNIYTRNMLLALASRKDNGAAFKAFIKVIDETLWSINPMGQRKDQELSVLIGRPLALVRASLSFKIKGLPFYNQDWQNTFKTDQSNYNDPNKPAPLGAIDGGIFTHCWQVHLGSQALRYDGLVGYYVDDPANWNSSFENFNAVSIPEGINIDYLKKIGKDGNYIGLHFIDDTVVSPDPRKGEVCHITMLVDPRAGIHAFTGILPVESLEIPGKFIKPALDGMSYTFRSGPLLTMPGEIRIPQPAENKGDWKWFDNVLKNTVPISTTDGKVNLSTTPPVVKEGWLKFKPDGK